jgi:hypothetical protein
MPISKYFGGHGKSVMADMVARHGKKAGEREFYATANARGQNPSTVATKKRKKKGK